MKATSSRDSYGIVFTWFNPVKYDKNNHVSGKPKQNMPYLFELIFQQMSSYSPARMRISNSSELELN